MYFAIDVGWTKTLLALFDSDGNKQEQLKFETPKNYEDFSLELAKNVAKIDTGELRWAVVAAPGLVDRKNGVVRAFGNLDWTNVPFQADAEKILNTPVTVENDAKLAGLSEALLVSDEFKKVLYLTISTGIGGALIIDGRIDSNFADMEVGQNLFEHNGELKVWEDFASGKAFYAKFGKKVADVPDDDHDTWYWFARNIAIGLVGLIATLTPEVIIIGGGAGAHLEKFKDRLDEQLKLYENPMVTIPPIKKAQNPEEAVIYGCYELAKQHHK
jgi:predicted NBD/HSP70 family sugar kinase